MKVISIDKKFPLAKALLRFQAKAVIKRPLAKAHHRFPAKRAIENLIANDHLAPALVEANDLKTLLRFQANDLQPLLRFQATTLSKRVNALLAQALVQALALNLSITGQY